MANREGKKFIVSIPSREAFYTVCKNKSMIFIPQIPQSLPKEYSIHSLFAQIPRTQQQGD